MDRNALFYSGKDLHMVAQRWSPALPPMPELRCERMADVVLLAKLRNKEPAKIDVRFTDTKTAYVTIFEDKPAGYGWSGANSVGKADDD